MIFIQKLDNDKRIIIVQFLYMEMERQKCYTIVVRKNYFPQ